MKRFGFLILVLLCNVSLSAQQKPVLFVRDTMMPAYILKLQEDKPNIYAVAKAYRDYYASHPFEKNSYTQYYKRWMQWARKNQDEQGNIEEKDFSDAEELQNALLKSRKQISRNKAANWKFLGPNQTYDTDGKTEVTWQTNIYSLDVALSDPRVVYAGGETGGIWKTTNKGLQWQLLTANILHDAIGALRIHPIHHDTVYAGTSGKLIKTVDGGKNWTTVYSEGGLFAHDIAIKPNNPNLVIAASNKGLLISSDAGKNWRKVFSTEA